MREKKREKKEKKREKRWRNRKVDCSTNSVVLLWQKVNDIGNQIWSYECVPCGNSVDMSPLEILLI